jgi:hypothetical protein
MAMSNATLWFFVAGFVLLAIHIVWGLEDLGHH